MKLKKLISLIPLLVMVLNGCSPTNKTSFSGGSVYCNEYVIDFDLNGGTSVSYNGPKTIETFSKDIFFFDCIKEGWNFRGWSYNGTKVFDEKGNQLANPTMASAMTFVAIYSQTVKMTIVSNLEGAGTITGGGEYPYNTYVDVSAYPNQGYEFVGWYYQNTLLSNINDYKYMMWSEDVTLEARFKLASYLINIHTNNQNYGLVLLKSTSNNEYLPEYQEYRSYTSSITISAYSKTDTRFLGWYNTSNQLVETNAVYSFVMPNYDYTLEAKWNYFAINYDLNGGTNNPNNPTSYTIDSNKIPLYQPTKTGYDFANWTYNGIIVTEIDPTWIDDITLVANWKAAKNNLSVMSEDISKGTVRIVVGSGYSDEEITIEATPVNDCVFKGWFCESKRISNDEIYSFIMPASDYSLVARFYSKTEYDEYLEKYGVKPCIASDGKTIVYGLYPQTNIDNSSIISALNSISDPESNGWYLYEGDYYAKVSATPYNSSYVFDNGTTIVSGTTYWFKCEPITWNVLSNDSGEYYLLSSVLLDVCVYPKTASNYKESEIRAWLNNDFFDSAFSLGNDYVLTTEVDNSALTTNDISNPYACENTQDKVFLQSYQDSINNDYGFSTSTDSTSTRYCKTTDWARARGGSCYMSSGEKKYNGTYWTRSHSSIGNGAWIIDKDGSLFDASIGAINICVRPGIILRGS